MAKQNVTGEFVIIESDALGKLIEVLKADYEVIGPTVREGAVIYEEISGMEELPTSWGDEHEGGKYRLHKRQDKAVFGFVVGPQSWKKFLFPPVLKLFSAHKKNGSFQVVENHDSPPRMAFLGVRACDLSAIAVQDKVFMNEKFTDSNYKSRRDDLFIVAVNCAEADGTCFCVSMNTGPKATFGFDLSMTEILAKNEHYFVVEIGTEKGAKTMEGVPYKVANKEQKNRAEGIVANTAKQMGRSMDTTDIKELLYRNYEHPRWEDVAERCLTCTNCTLVCPTCFCATIEDVTDLSGETAERWRKWDSCFTKEHSYVHGGSVRTSAVARYRQWMTHKLATWIDQFGTSGCVGCGRCITWCPVGIDITEEARAIRENDLGVKSK
ncbi:sulfite reductase subunit A [candidate division KSB1 bacterium]|nr:sulfite reductase subunit A [candidate division KSB1 bacterium]NIR72789.1 sulfite reductase subunit A [candidate division KSB1 bacterium]NIS23745.1 sulfite reductase subunit A [candidate division KSB1 bacterium]NIT70666.1 sulfite reductase subunit A [candidate division KSB1 bacterium]NIU24393.1 sulfite reductase subunit A [candidate division KSB1 bacterium]